MTRASQTQSMRLMIQMISWLAFTIVVCSLNFSYIYIMWVYFDKSCMFQSNLLQLDDSWNSRRSWWLFISSKVRKLRSRGLLQLRFYKGIIHSKRESRYPYRVCGPSNIIFFEISDSFCSLTFEGKSPFSSRYCNVPKGHFLHFLHFLHFMLSNNDYRLCMIV